MDPRYATDPLLSRLIEANDLAGVAARARTLGDAFLNHGNNDHCPAVAECCRLGRSEALALVLKAGGNPETMMRTPRDEDVTAAGFAADRGDPQLLRALLDHGAQPCRADARFAARGGHAECLSMLLERAPHLAVRATLYAATRARQPACVELVLKHRVSDELLHPRDGASALHHGAELGCPECVRVLLEHGANPNRPGGPCDGTPLHSAVVTSKPQVIALLVSRGAEPNARDDRGATPLHVAVAFHRFECIDPLLSAGADPMAEAPDGRTPLQTLRSWGSHALAERMVAGARAHGLHIAQATPHPGDHAPGPGL